MADKEEGAGRRRYADELRSEIDHGRTGDKVAYPDPAAAPLGTDEEAAGAPPPPGAVARAITDETGAAQTADTGVVLSGGPAYAVLTIIVVGVLVMMFFAISNFN